MRTMTLNGVGSVGDVQAFRDPAWARREAAYHAAALAEVNECVRRYNALAPYAVRRPLYVLEAELAGVYARAVEDVARALDERSKPRETALRKQTLRATTSHKDPDWSWIRRLGDLLVAVVRRLARLVRVRTR